MNTSQQEQQQTAHNNLTNISSSSTNGNTSSNSLASLVPGGVVTTQNISTVIKPKENNNSMQFVKITPPDLSKKAVEQIRVAQESKITKDKLKEVEEEWQSNLLKWKSKRRQNFVGPSSNGDTNDDETNNNNIDSSGGRKVKTFAQIIEQRAKTGNRLKFNLQRYIESDDDDEQSGTTAAKSDPTHDDASLQSSDEVSHEDQIHPQDPKELETDHSSKALDRQNTPEPIEKVASEHLESQTAPNLSPSTQQSQLRDVGTEPSTNKIEPPNRLPQLKLVPRPPSSPKPHLEMLKQKFESLNQNQAVSPLPFQRAATNKTQKFELPAQRSMPKDIQRRSLCSLPEPQLSPPALSPKNNVSSEHTDSFLGDQTDLATRRRPDVPPQKPVVPSANIKVDSPAPEQAEPLPPKQQDPLPPRLPVLFPAQQDVPQPRQYDPIPPHNDLLPPRELEALPRRQLDPLPKQSEAILPKHTHSLSSAGVDRSEKVSTDQSTLTSSGLGGQVRPNMKSFPQPPPPHPNQSILRPELPPRSSEEYAPKHDEQSTLKAPYNQPPKQKEDKDRTVLSVSGKRRCSSCKEELGRGAAAFVVESLNLVYHTNCFKCSVCHVDLSNGFRGVDVRVHAGALHCQNCYSKDGLNYSRV